MAYDAAKSIIEGLKGSSTREELQNKLSQNFSIDGATGKIQFQQWGDRKDGKVFLVEVQKGNKSGTGYDFHCLYQLIDKTLGDCFTKNEN